MRLKEEKRKNFRERIWFIKYWVEYMETHSDKEWSEAQRKLIVLFFQILVWFLA
jgi:hypothetical protein